MIAYVPFVDGQQRPVYEDPDGRQVRGRDGGNRVYGTWFIPKDKADDPVVVDRTVAKL